MTECNQSAFPFEEHFSRRVVAKFDGAQMTTEGGALLLRETDRKIGLLQRVAACFTDTRDPQRIEHGLSEMLAQRIYGLALGYEDLNDHEELRRDPLLGVLAGKWELGEPLAGKSTLNRLELTPVGSPRTERYHKIGYSAAGLDQLLVDVFLEAHQKPPREMVLDLDATDTPLHGEQEGRFFHGYYGQYCYLPLYIYCGEHLLCARLRPSNIDASAGSRGEIERIVRQIRQQWPKVRIILRADSYQRMKLADAAALVVAGIEETLYYYTFPREHWRCLRTNNPLERLLREVRRRTRAVGAFPDGKSALMLAAAHLRHVAGTKWGTRRYLDMNRLADASEAA
jgi:hypothetical protein